ncbi:putative Histidine-rich protein II [Xanthomonas phaseoli pv. phaseoli]|nr:putative Histidine-rich protein II [Xanthomonas phaseoli pv. phaseoli]
MSCWLLSVDDELGAAAVVHPHPIAAPAPGLAFHAWRLGHLPAQAHRAFHRHAAGAARAFLRFAGDHARHRDEAGAVFCAHLEFAIASTRDPDFVTANAPGAPFLARPHRALPQQPHRRATQYYRACHGAPIGIAAHHAAHHRCGLRTGCGEFGAAALFDPHAIAFDIPFATADAAGFGELAHQLHALGGLHRAVHARQVLGLAAHHAGCAVGRARIGEQQQRQAPQTA